MRGWRLAAVRSVALMLATQWVSQWAGGAASQATIAADYPAPREGDVVLRDFKFKTGETLPELRIHYHAFGQPKRDSHGVVRNAVLIVHGTGGSGSTVIAMESLRNV